jgi:glycine zipper 2TM protein
MENSQGTFPLFPGETMKSLLLALAVASGISACSDLRDRRVPAADNSAQRPDLTLPDTTARRDTSIALSSRGEQPVSPVEQAAPTPRRRQHPAPRPKPAKAVKPAADTITRAYAPNTRSDTTPATADSVARDTNPAPADTARRPQPDSAVAAPTDTVAARTGDTTSIAAADSAAAPTPAADTTAVSSSVAAAPPAGAAGGVEARTLATGTEIHAALDDSITSRRDTVGQTITAHVMENVTGPDGRTLIAAGAPVRFTVTRLSPSRSKGSQGSFALRADGIALKGQLQPVKASVQPVPRELRGRGVTGSDAAKVGVGAAGGAVLGRVIGGNTKGTVIGGVAGAAAGAVVANQTATRDVVVKAKTPVVIVLTEPLVTP